MKDAKLGFKVGIFVLLAIVLLGYLTVKITKYKKLLVMRGYEIHAIFDDAFGLKENTSVYIAGVNVGRIKRIGLTKHGKADVCMLIKPNVKIRRDSEAKIRTRGMVGTKYIEIVQGKSEEILKPNMVIEKTTCAANMDNVINDADLTLRRINDYLAKERETLERATENLQRISSNISEIAQKINRGKGTFGKLINDRALYDSFKDEVDRLGNIIEKLESGKGTLGKLINDEKLYEEAKKTIDNLSDIVARINSGKGSLGKLIYDKALYEEAKNTLDKMSKIVADIQNGKGTLGKLVKDESLYNDIKDVMRSIKKTSETVKEQTPLSVIGTAVGIAK